MRGVDRAAFRPGSASVFLLAVRGRRCIGYLIAGFAAWITSLAATNSSDRALEGSSRSA